jgi:hypothetical protein
MDESFFDDNFIVLVVRPMTMDDINNVKNTDVRELLGFDEDIDDEYLKDSDYFVTYFIYNNEEYILYYGYPGDNPNGIFTKNGETIDYCAEGWDRYSVFTQFYEYKCNDGNDGKDYFINPYVRSDDIKIALKD